MAKGGGYIHGTLGLACFALVIAMAGATQFNVGGANGWSVPGANAESYNDWAEKTRFQVGDKLVFVYPKDKDSVLLVEPADYNACNTSSYVKRFADGNTVFDLDRSGAFFFISGVDANCLANEKLIVMVLAARNATAASPCAIARLFACCFVVMSVAAMAGATQYKVGGDGGWAVPGAGAESYNTWAEKTSFQIGDQLLFVYPKDKDSVLEVEPADYNSCNTASYDKKFADGSTAFDLDRAGAFFFISGVDDNCRAGEKLIVMVANSTTTTSSPPPSSSSSSPSGNNPPAGKPAGTANGGGGSKSGAAGITAATSGIAGVVVAAVAYVAAIAI
uniref:Phytocyanin domain-containing protein n=1 Tax=Leersia perrieri TaxID=77586 RepID=A0A0D9VCI2_9ORYZ